MGAWGPLQRQLMLYLARHPEFKKTLQNGADKLRRSPPFKRAEERAKTYYNRTVADAAAAASQGQQQQRSHANAGPKFSFFNEMKRKMILQWHKHKGRVIAFVTANFFFIIMAFQFVPVLWHGMVSGVKALTAPEPEHKKHSKKQEDPQQQQHLTAANEEERSNDGSARRTRRQRKSQPVSESTDGCESMDRRRYELLSSGEMDSVTQQQQTLGPFSHLTERLNLEATTKTSAAAAPTGGSGVAVTSSPFSSSMFDDTYGAASTIDNKNSVQDQFNEMHQGLFQGNSNEHSEVKVGFDTSFLVKMGDETEFTSSLDRENLTGKNTAH